MVWALTVTGQPARSATCAADVAGLGALGQHAAPYDVIDFAGLDARALDRRGERKGAKGGAGGGIERAPVGAPDRGAGGGDDDGVADGHGNSPR